MGNSEIVRDTKIYPFLLKLQTGDRKYFVNGMQGSAISKKKCISKLFGQTNAWYNLT